MTMVIVLHSFNILNIRYLYSLSQLHIVIMPLPKTLVFTPLWGADITPFVGINHQKKHEKPYKKRARVTHFSPEITTKTLRDDRKNRLFTPFCIKCSELAKPYCCCPIIDHDTRNSLPINSLHPTSRSTYPSVGRTLKTWPEIAIRDSSTGTHPKTTKSLTQIGH